MDEFNCRTYSICRPRILQRLVVCFYLKTLILTLFAGYIFVSRNSESVNYFWRTWNIPVYRWSVRHVYLPLLSNNVNHLLAVMIVFSISALFHEYLISVPLNMYRVWIFTGMVLQFPLAYLVKKLPKNFANYAVWLILIIGQPLCILMYYHDFYVIHFLKPKQS